MFDAAVDASKKALNVTEEQQEALEVLANLTRVKRKGNGGEKMVTTQSTYPRMTGILAEGHSISADNQSLGVATDERNHSFSSSEIFPGAARKLD